VSTYYDMYFWKSHDKVICVLSAAIIVNSHSSVDSLWKVPCMGGSKETHGFV